MGVTSVQRTYEGFEITNSDRSRGLTTGPKRQTSNIQMATFRLCKSESWNRIKKQRAQGEELIKMHRHEKNKKTKNKKKEAKEVKRLGHIKNEKRNKIQNK